jgi:hypothetical protein
MHLELLFPPLNLKRKKLIQQYQQSTRGITQTHKSAPVSLFHTQKVPAKENTANHTLTYKVHSRQCTTFPPYQNHLWSPYNPGTSNLPARQPNAFQAQCHRQANPALHHK